MSWINKDTEIYCSFAKKAGNTGCQMMNSAFYYYGLNKIYKSFSVNDIKSAVDAVRCLNIKGFAITMPYKIDVLDYVDEASEEVIKIGAANTVINTDGVLKAYNTDHYAAKAFLNQNVYFKGGRSLEGIAILGNGGYSKAVQTAIRDVGHDEYTIITRSNWDIIKGLKECLIYNCTPVENIEHDNSNDFIDCIVKTKTGKELSWLQASRQFNLYTGKELPIRNI